MSTAFDPYHKWLGIRDRIRPPNHYRLLGLELFEDDADVISAAADQRIAHVRTYQLGPHSAVSQRILNELANAKLCLLNPAQKTEYDRKLRGQSIVADAQKPDRVADQPHATIPEATDTTGNLAARDDIPLSVEPAPERPPPRLPATRPSLRADIRRSRPVARSMRPSLVWQLAAAASAAATVLVALTVYFVVNSQRHANHVAVPSDRQNQKASPATVEPESTDHFKPTLANASGAEHTNVVQPPPGHVPDPSSAPPETRESKQPNVATRPFESLPQDLSERFRAVGLPNADFPPDSELVQCYEIAQLVHAHVAVVALLCASDPSTREQEITRAIAKIDELNVFSDRSFADLVVDHKQSSTGGSVGAKAKPPALARLSPKVTKSWQEVERCFDDYASGVNHLCKLLEATASLTAGQSKTTNHVARTQLLFQAVVNYARTKIQKQGSNAVFEGIRRLDAIVASSEIDSLASGTALQQLCHWTLRICETLSALCEFTLLDSTSRVSQLRLNMIHQDHSSGIAQLRSLLLIELDLWALLAQNET